MPNESLDRSKAYESSGLVLDGGAYLSSGSAVPTHSANNGDWYFREGTLEIYTHNGTQWILRNFGEGGGSQDITMSWAAESQNYTWTVFSSYTQLTEFIFPGTTRLGIPSGIDLLIGSNRADQDASFRLYDRTNALQIAEVTVTSLDRIIVDVGTLSNLPTGNAVVEVQGKRIGTNAQAQLSSMRIKF